MRQSTYSDEKTTDADALFNEFEFVPITLRENVTQVAITTGPENGALDLFLSIVKWTLLYVPGAAALHFALMAMSLLFFYGASMEMLVGTFGISVVAMFMVMLGVGRLNDLRYLRVVGGILAAGSIASILYSLAIVFFPGDFFGWFTLLTLPLTIIIGQLIKLKTDRETLPHE